MQLNAPQRRALDSVWRAFDDRDVTYVVLRGYEGLPESIGGSDVDVLVADDSFDAAVSYCKRTFEREESLALNAVGLASMVAANPQGVVRDVAASPTRAAAVAKRRLVSSDVSSRQYVERSFDAAGLTIDLANHLAYRSPMDGSKIRVDPAVEDDMFDNRVDRGAFYAPAAPDELAHLVCRGVYDYEGEFPERHASRCDALVEELRSDSERDERFRELLSELFYEADNLVYDLVTDGEYDAIRSRLRRYSDY